MEKERFVELTTARVDMMYRVAYSILRHDEDCKDAMQEAALKAWAKRHTLRDERFFATWLTRILINECRGMVRKRHRLYPLEEAFLEASPAYDHDLAMALSALPEKLRLPMVLHYSEGMSYEEVAKVLHITQSTVTGRIHRAKLQLRKEIEA